jgi:hypothetical protein
MRTIKIFLSSPSDVKHEQNAVKALAAEINDVIVFLAPDLHVKVEIVHYESNVYPDAGSPQDVVDRQIPDNYDIHLGIMWRRCGTPTRSVKSGTIHEFEQAKDRRDKTGRPVIMFYFSDEPPPTLPRTKEEIEQLGSVIEFRDRLQTLCLTVSYPDHTSFRERVRVGLLRAIADLVKQKLPDGDSKSNEKEAKDAVPEALKVLGARYDEIRLSMKAGNDRTRFLQTIFDEMVALAPNSHGALIALQSSGSAGERLAAIAILSVLPNEEHLDWLAERLDPEKEKPFVGYRAAVALSQAVESLLPQSATQLLGALQKALDLAELNQNDPNRAPVLKRALSELKRLMKRASEKRRHYA